MKVAFDYLQGPALGHRTRCEILQRELIARGHCIVEPWDKQKDWLVWDYPCVPHATTVVGYKRLLMGQLPQAPNDYAWHPLGAEAERTMHGPQYIMLDKPSYTWSPSRNMLITCGGSDPFGLTEKLLVALGHHQECGVIIGPNFGRALTVPEHWTRYDGLNSAGVTRTMSFYETLICAWGQTVFDALAMGTRVLPITTQPEHPAEAEILGIPYITRYHDFTDDTLLFRAIKSNFGMDYQGATRVVEQIEAWL
jgi:spore coat polysaccharide biosynthesis predicted glycosyltransferase SpsG